MFVDHIKIRARAGCGGNGCASFRREKYVPKGGPDGGDGGRGGDVVLLADGSVNNLVDFYFKPILEAEPGGHGRGKKMRGRDGRDCVVKVPCGTIVHRVDTGEAIADMLVHGQRLVLCRGGRGGLGNWRFRSATHQAPREATPGEEGEEGEFELELKTVADVGLVGYPNAGKSTLLSKISAAHPKVAPYPFTTLHPIVGVVKFKDYSTLTVADIPGLIEGAHAGVGLGHEFLRHIERCKMLLVLLDMAATDGRDPGRDYQQLLQELKLYRADLLKKPRLVVANKMDLPAAKKHLADFRRRFAVRPLLLISAEKGIGLEGVLRAIHRRAGKKVRANGSS